MAALRSILGSPKTAAEEYTAPKQTSTAPVYPSLYQHQQQQQQQQQYPPVPQQPAGYQNEGGKPILVLLFQRLTPKKTKCIGILDKAIRIHLNTNIHHSSQPCLQKY
jgi:hypothetical protein